jgi:4-hydroxy-3-polyprenylbenzoate decarboxylase
VINIKHYIVAITGASGAVYAQRLLRFLADKGYGIYLLVSDAGKLLLKEELGIELTGTIQEIQEQIKRSLLSQPDYNNLQYIDNHNLMAGIASGSVNTEAMLVVPCSMGSLARIALGMSNNLIERAADITLKEGRPLIIAPRETPLNQIQLKNMLSLARAGARIVPCMPAFYHHPGSINDLVDFIAGRLLDTLGIEHNLYVKWRGND